MLLRRVQSSSSSAVELASRRTLILRQASNGAASGRGAANSTAAAYVGDRNSASTRSGSRPGGHGARRRRRPDSSSGIAEVPPLPSRPPQGTMGGWREPSFIRSPSSSGGSITNGGTNHIRMPLAGPSAGVATENNNQCNRRFLEKKSALRQEMLDVLVSGELATAVNVLDKIKEQERQLNVPLALQLIAVCAKAKAWHLIVDGILRSPAFPVDQRIFLDVLQACVAAPRWRPALAIIHDIMPQRGVIPDAAAYRAAIAACGHCQESGEVLTLLDEMEARGLINRASIQDIHALVMDAAKAGAWDAALVIMKQYFTLQSSRAQGQHQRELPQELQGATATAGALALEKEMVETSIEACRRAISSAYRLNESTIFNRMSTKLWEVVQLARGVTNASASSESGISTSNGKSNSNGAGVELSRTAWTSLIKVGSKAGRAVDVAQMVEAMTEEGVGGGQSVINRLGRLQSCLKQNSWESARNILREMLSTCEGDGPPQSDRLVTTVLECGLKGSLEDEALRLFESWLAHDDESFSPTASARMLAVRLCLRMAENEGQIASRNGREGALQRLDNILGRFEEQTHGQREVMCTMVMEHFKRNVMLAEAFQLLHAMRFLGIPRRIQTLMPLFQLCDVAGRPREALKLLEEMEQSDGVQPNGSAYNEVIHAATKADLVNDALQVLHAMRNHGVYWNQTACASILFALARKGDWNTAMTLLNDMRTAYGDPPSLISYTAVVDACANGGAWEMALLLMRRMEDEGVMPNNYTFSSAIKACARAGKWQHAAELFHKMEERGLPINEVTYTAILNAYAKAGRSQDAIACFRGMQTRGLNPTTPHFTAVIDACSQNGDYQEALKWLNEMRRLGVPINRVCYTAAVCACGRGGAWDEAVKILSEMLHCSRSQWPSSVTYMLAMDACARSDQWPVAAYLWDLIELVDPNELNLPVLNAFICSMDDPSLQTLSTRYYNEAYAQGRVTHWSFRHFRTIDLHNFSRPLAKHALRLVLDDMVQAYSRSNDNQTYLQQQQQQQQQHRNKRQPFGRNLNNSTDTSTSGPTYRYVQDPNERLIIVTGHGKNRETGAVLRDELSEFLVKEFDPPLQTCDVANNPGRMLVMPPILLAYAKAQVRKNEVEEKDD